MKKLKSKRIPEVENFICYMIDNCEREIITEEYLQNIYAGYLKATAKGK